MGALAELNPGVTNRIQQKTDAERFFETLWPDDLPGVIYLSTIEELKSGKKQVLSYWFDEIKEAADYIPKLNGADIYYGIGLAAEKPAGPESSQRSHRCKQNNVVALPALWADVDVDKEGSKKKYFPTRGAARDFLNGLVLKPSMLVWSGGGYHAYWLFNEPALITSTRERDQMMELSKGWQDYLRKEAGKDEIIIDSTHNIDRILRVVGTVNHKWNTPVEVENYNDTRYNPYDFDDYISTTTLSPTPDQNQNAEDLPIAEPITGGKIIYDFKNAQPPAEKFAALIEIEPKFQQSWNRTRTGLKDNSASAYDLSLASLAAHAGWTDQEIVDLIIAHRRKFSDLGKLVKRTPAQVEDYFFNPSYGCVRKALNDAAASPESLKSLIEKIYSLDPGSDERTRLTSQLFPHIKTALGLPITKISKHSRDISAQYIITLAGSEQIIIKNIRDFQNQKVWLDHACNFAINAGSAPPVAKKLKEWSTLLRALSLVVTLDFDPEADEINETQFWIRRLAEFAPNYKYLDHNDCEDGGCFLRDGLVWIRVDELISSVAMHGGGRFKRNSMISRLKTAGFERREFTFAADKNGKRKTRSFFVTDYEKLLLGE